MGTGAKWALALGAPNAYLKKTGGWVQDTWGTPSPNVHLPLMLICPSAHF